VAIAACDGIRMDSYLCPSPSIKESCEARLQLYQKGSEAILFIWMPPIDLIELLNILCNSFMASSAAQDLSLFLLEKM
jgi:hypothetical protein